LLPNEFVLGGGARARRENSTVLFTVGRRCAGRGYPLCGKCAHPKTMIIACHARGGGRVDVTAARGSRSAVALDLDGDGDLDIVTNEFNAPPQVLLSDLAERRRVNFVKIRLRGTRSNREGLGSLVTVVTADGRR